jgi:hypothetical protein
LAPSFGALKADVAAQLAPVRGIERSQLRADWHSLAVSWDHDAGPSAPPTRGVGVGKRRWYATIFSVDRPRSRSISTEHHGRSLSRAGPTPHSSSPWPLPCRPLVFTCASSVSSRQARGWPGTGLFQPPKPWCIEHARVLRTRAIRVNAGRRLNQGDDQHRHHRGRPRRHRQDPAGRDRAARRRRGRCFIHLKEAIVDRLGAMRGPGESYSDVILRLVEIEAAAP